MPKPPVLMALSIRQPYAWLVAAGHKPVENRTWRTKYRGLLLIHAGKTIGEEMHAAAAETWLDAYGSRWPVDDLHYGGIVGVVEVVDCVEHYDSPWFFGPYGLVVDQPKELPFSPLSGQRGLFEVPVGLLQRVTVESLNAWLACSDLAKAERYREIIAAYGA